MRKPMLWPSTTKASSDFRPKHKSCYRTSPDSSLKNLGKKATYFFPSWHVFSEAETRDFRCKAGTWFHKRSIGTSGTPYWYFRNPLLVLQEPPIGTSGTPRTLNYWYFRNPPYWYFRNRVAPLALEPCGLQKA